MIKYFNFAEGNLNNKPGYQVTAGPNWSWISFSKLPYLLDALWPLIATPDHFPVFRNEKNSEAGIVPFVVMLYLFRVYNQWYMYFMFLLYYFAYFCLLLQSVWLIWYLFISCKMTNHISLLLKWYSAVCKLLENCILLFYQKKFKFWFSGRHTMIYGMSPLPKIRRGADEFWTVIIPGDWSFWNSRELYLLNLMKILHFSRNFSNFSFGFSFYANTQKCCLQQSWAWH